MPAPATDPDATLRRLRARVGGLALAASHDPREYTAAARAAFLGKFAALVDPGGALPVEERLRRAEAARRAHFTRLAIRSAEKRRGRANRKSKAVNQTAASTGQVPTANVEAGLGGSLTATQPTASR